MTYRPEGLEPGMDAGMDGGADPGADARLDADARVRTGTGDASPGAGADARAARGAGPAGGVSLPALGPRGWLRWMWRQLTSMRVALLLLMLLAAAAVPGSIFPQRPSSPERVLQYLTERPTLGPWLDRLGLFDVYGSVWFSAIYLLLFVSLVGCIVPRTLAHLRGVRAEPPKVPRRLDRFPAQGRVVSTASPQDVADAGAAALRGRGWLPRYRVRVSTEVAGGRAVAAERGYLRETGNLLFHLSLLGLLVAIAVGQVFTFRGQAIIQEGRGFANAGVGYDTFQSGPGFTPESLAPFSITLDAFEAEFTADARARDFTAYVTVHDVDASERQETIKVNSPLTVAGAKIYLQGNGYAPSVTVRDSTGAVAFAGPLPFLPQDGVYTSRGVVKVPDVAEGEQIGLVGAFLPTAVVTEAGAQSVYPQPLSPLLVLSVWAGDLGLDTGLPQNAYELDESGMRQLLDDGGDPVTLFLEPGQTVDLPEGLGTISFDELDRFVALDLRHDPALTWILVFSLGALGGLMLSLFTPRRRVWLRVGADDAGRTVVVAAGLARGEDPGLQAELDAVLAALPEQVDADHGDPAHGRGEDGR